MQVQRKQFQLLHWSIMTQLYMDIKTVQTSFYIGANKAAAPSDTGRARLNQPRHMPLAPDHQADYSSIAAFRHLVQFTTMF
jgi:hypothetical protein